MDVIILHVPSVLLVNARASLLSGNVMETMTVGTTVMKMAAVRIPFLTVFVKTECLSRCFSVLRAHPSFCMTNV